MRRLAAVAAIVAVLLASAVEPSIAASGPADLTVGRYDRSSLVISQLVGFGIFSTDPSVQVKKIRSRAGTRAWFAVGVRNGGPDPGSMACDADLPSSKVRVTILTESNENVTDLWRAGTYATAIGNYTILWYYLRLSIPKRVAHRMTKLYTFHCTETGSATEDSVTAKLIVR